MINYSNNIGNLRTNRKTKKGKKNNPMGISSAKVAGLRTRRRGYSYDMKNF